jgi:hypothetical protein
MLQLPHDGDSSLAEGRRGEDGVQCVRVLYSFASLILIFYFIYFSLVVVFIINFMVLPALSL